MEKIPRERCGYLWVSKEEAKMIDRAIAASNIYKKSKFVRSKADFIRIATITLGRLLEKKAISLDQNIESQDQLISSLIEKLSKK